MTAVERKPDFKLTIDTTYLTLTGELWGVYCEDWGENWPRYNDTALYLGNVAVKYQVCAVWRSHIMWEWRRRVYRIKQVKD